MQQTKSTMIPSFLAFIMSEAEPVQQTASQKQDLPVHLTDLNELVSMLPAKPVPQKPTVSQKNAVPQPKAPVVLDNSALMQHFQQNGLTVVQMKRPECEAAFPLVKAIQDSLPDSAHFLRVLRNKIAENDGQFYYNVHDMKDEQRSRIHNLVQRMKECGCFAVLDNKNWLSGDRMSGTVAYEPRIRNFLNGIWLEHFCQLNAGPIIREIASKQKLPYVIADNVILQNIKGERHEFDLLFSIGDKIFGTEQKSGSNFYQFDQYRACAEWLGVPQEQFMLIRADQQNKENMQCAQFFYRFYICDTSNFRQMLTEMLERAFA